MKALLITQGSRGDLQPFVALAKGLRSAGHDAILCGPATLTNLPASYDIPYIPLYDFTARGLADPAAGNAVKARRNRHLRYLIQQGNWSRSLMYRALDDTAAINYDGIDVVVFNHMVPANEIAEWLNVPAIPTSLSPFLVATDEFPNPWFPFKIPRLFNRASYLATHLLLRYFIGDNRTWRYETLGLPRRRGRRNILRQADGSRSIVLQPFSRHILPAATSYPDWAHTTGYWFLSAPSDWTPPQQLSAFLQQGDPPVYIGFGSLNSTDNQAHLTENLIVDAVSLAGVRAVVSIGRKRIKSATKQDDILYLEDPVPFDWLFQRMAAIVHHGGSGTTGTALASGRPQVICPFALDQPFFAARMHAVGVAPFPQPHHALTAKGLAGAIRRATTDNSMAIRAEQLARHVRSEHGVTATVTILESLT